MNAFGMVAPVYAVERWIGGFLGVEGGPVPVGVLFLAGMILLPAGLGLGVLCADYVPLMFGEVFTPAVPLARILVACIYAAVAFNVPGILLAIDERYRAEPLDSSVYDTELEQRVIAFQRDHRLDVDGLAGRQTQIIINSLLGPEDTPRLKTPMLARE